VEIDRLEIDRGAALIRPVRPQDCLLSGDAAVDPTTEIPGDPGSMCRCQKKSVLPPKFTLGHRRRGL
jgi:hypothetical protein